VNEWDERSIGGGEINMIDNVPEAFALLKLFCYWVNRELSWYCGRGCKSLRIGIGAACRSKARSILSLVTY